MTENTFEITLKSGRKFIVRPLPKHFFIYYGELPTAMMNQAVEAVKAGREEEFGKEIGETLTAEEIKKLFIFTREAVNYFCVNPKITLTPQNENEISPFEITEKEFSELLARAMKSAGGLAEGLDSFRTESD